MNTQSSFLIHLQEFFDLILDLPLPLCQQVGSTLKVNEGIKLLIEKALGPFEDAIDAASINPMKYIGMDDYKGRIRYGYDTDIVV